MEISEDEREGYILHGSLLDIRTVADKGALMGCSWLAVRGVAGSGYCSWGLWSGREFLTRVIDRWI